MGALELLRQANELGPPLSTTWEIGAYIQSGSISEALEELEKVKRERESDPILIYDTGMVYAAQGKRSEALQTQIVASLAPKEPPNYKNDESASSAWRDLGGKISEDHYRFKSWTALVATTPCPPRGGPTISHAVEKTVKIWSLLQRGA